MATDTRASGDRAKAGGGAPAGGRAAPSEPQPAGEAWTPPEEPLFEPLWARLAIGAAAVVIVAAAGQVMFRASAVWDKNNIPSVEPLPGLAIFVLLPAVATFLCSAIADLDLEAPRWDLALKTALMTGLSALVAAVLRTQVTYFLVPLGFLGGPLVRALAAPPPRGVRRVEYAISWSFLSVFWPTAAVIGAGFILKRELPHALALAFGGTAIGAMLTWTYAKLDPDATPEPDPAAAGAEGDGTGGAREERSGGAGS